MGIKARSSSDENAKTLLALHQRSVPLDRGLAFLGRKSSGAQQCTGWVCLRCCRGLIALQMVAVLVRVTVMLRRTLGAADLS